MRRAELPPPDECANCGAAIPPRARACPECGADELTGWREGSVYDGLDLPDTAENEDARGARPTPPRRGPAWYWLLVAGLVLVLFVLGLVTFR